jgi:SAM-dependent methyltransferase
MMYTELANRVVSVLGAMTPLQREGIRRSIQVPNLALPENAALWDTISPALQGDGQANDSPLEDVRAALEALPPESWRLLNNALFVLYRGNIFDESCEYIEGGGIRFGFDGLQGQRYAMFLSLVDAEADRIGRNISILDVGCWQGTLMCELLQRGYAVAGTDICQEVEPIIRDRVRRLRPEHRLCLGFRTGWSHEALTHYHDGAFDLLTCAQTLEHVPAAVLQQTCDEMLRVAKHSIMVEVPGWDDGWPVHLRVYTIEQLERLFCREGWHMDVLQAPGGGVYTTVKVVRE